MVKAKNALSSFSSDTTVYHYCDSEAFLGLVENGEVWASDLRAMNDPRESLDGHDQITSILEEQEAADGSVLDEFNQAVSQKIGDFKSNLRFFVSSFTYNRDDLYSWQNYSSKGQGFAIGFKKKLFGSDLVDVIYTQGDFREKIRSLLVEGQTKFTGAGDEKAKSSALFNTALRMSIQTASFKHHSWKMENEARLVLPMFYSPIGSPAYSWLGANEGPSANAKFRATRFGIRPYLAKSLHDSGSGGDRNSAISEVVIGPNNPTDMEVASACLKTYGLENVVASKSKCEFR